MKPSDPLTRLRVAMISRTVSLFAHAGDPLEHTLDYAGDPGLMGPGSVSWEVMGDVSGFIGGIRALLVQAAHPEVVAGVADHSRYREDPLGRLSRWVAEHPAVGPSPGMRDAVDFLRQPPLDPAVLFGYRLLASAAVVTLPPRVRAALGLKPRPGAHAVGRGSMQAMRWAFGASPRWRMALERTGSPIDERRFKQKRPFETLETT